MTKSRIKAMALSSGFKLKEQPNGEMDLNPYVYEFAKLLELAELYDRNKEIKERFILLADNFENELIEESINYLLERNAIFRLICGE
jgi:hypothetical protein